MSRILLGTALLLAVKSLSVIAAPLGGQREAWSNWAGGSGLNDADSSIRLQLLEQEKQRNSSDPDVRKRYMCNGAGTIVIEMAEARDSGALIDHVRDAAIERWHTPKKLADDLAKMTYINPDVAPMDLGKNMAKFCESKPNGLAAFGFLLE